MKVLLFSKYSRNGASSRLRSLQYIPALADEGIDVSVSSLFDDGYLEELYAEGYRSKVRSLVLYMRRLLALIPVFRHDMIWIEKELFPYFPAVFERLLAFLRVRYVVDYDDAIFHNYDLSGSGLVQRLLGRKIDKVMAGATCVIVGNQYLADRALQAGAERVKIIPTVVDHNRYLQTARAGDGQLVIGWIGSPSTQRYVVDIQDAIRAVCEQTGARLMLVGATEGMVGELAGIPVEVISWSEASEAECIANMDIGIMPLVDGPWEKGKCGYKLIQYMASGVPVVASPVGVNVEIVNGCVCGRLAHSIDEWTASLLELLSDDEVRDKFGRAGRDAVEKRYSLASQVSILADVLRSAIR
jgi:glycosyltransferase involved in cell wall biosynthesis